MSECGLVWFGSVWCGEAKIYVLMSFPDIKFFPLNVTQQKKKCREQARYILKHLYKPALSIFACKMPFEQPIEQEKNALNKNTFDIGFGNDKLHSESGVNHVASNLKHLAHLPLKCMQHE